MISKYRSYMGSRLYINSSRMARLDAYIDSAWQDSI